MPELVKPLEKKGVCPHCGAMAQHSWHRLVLEPEQSTFTAWLAATQGRPVPEPEADAAYRASRFLLSRCFACDRSALWAPFAETGIAARVPKMFSVVYPAGRHPVQPHPEMPHDVANIFEEAATVRPHSPRAAAALLRLAAESLCRQITQQGGMFNALIEKLQVAGWPKPVIDALDVIRSNGNDAVHPGEIQLDEQVQTCDAMFGLLNFIVDEMIAHPRKLRELTDALPPGVKVGIVQRTARAESPGREAPSG